MPPRNLRVPYSEFLERNTRHTQIAKALPDLQPALQKALAELIMIRLFDDFLEALSGVAYRLACDTPYLDRSNPVLLAPAASSALGARTLFETHNRTKFQHVKWSKARYVKDTVKHVFDVSDHYLVAVDTHSARIAEMQAVRNRIAHRNSNSRKAFDVVLRRIYGGAPGGGHSGFAPNLWSRLAYAPLSIPYGDEGYTEGLCPRIDGLRRP